MGVRYRDIYIGLNFDVVVEITKSSAFPAAAASTWTWKLRMDKDRTAGGTPDLEHSADSKALSNGNLTITLTFNLTAAKTANLIGGQNQVDIVSDDGSGKVLPWPEARGVCDIIQPLGTVT